MKCRTLAIAGVIGIALVPGWGWSACPPSCAIPGGGPAATDCHAEFATTQMKLNYPPFDPARPTKPRKTVRCFDGDPGCDLDGVVNNSCTFNIDVCLRNSDPALPSCTAADVTSVVVSGRSTPSLQALQTAIDGLLPATANTCTTGQALTLPLKGPNSKGVFKKATKTVRLRARTASQADADHLTYTCMPHGWPTHGYNYANHRATPIETNLSPANASTLVQKWVLDLGSIEGGSNNGVTSTPTVFNGVVYVSSWNGKVYAVKASNGVVKWTYDTGSGGAVVPGLQSSVTATADGRVVVGDANGTVRCLNAANGHLLWTATVADTDPVNSHIWDSPVVASNRVFVGRASHNDGISCTPGHEYAFDLDTGAELWRYQTIPSKVCQNDTTIACTTDADCGGAPGSCVNGLGAGVTASVATDPTGETVYMVTVGCYTFPSIGKSESFFSLNAATGAENWTYRTQPGEQFPDGPAYHDYGFLNGPVLIDADDGLGGTRPLLVGGSKDGTLYAVDPASGAPVWTNPLIPLPDFAGFGLFNGALGFANHKLFAALDGTSLFPALWPGANDHLYAFNDLDGTTAWSDQIGGSWGSMAVANGLLFVGTNNTIPEYYVYDAATGARLKTISMPSTVTSGAAIVDGSVYVGYGVFGSAGGVLALGLP